MFQQAAQPGPDGFRLVRIDLLAGLGCETLGAHLGVEGLVPAQGRIGTHFGQVPEAELAGAATREALTEVAKIRVRLGMF